MPVCWYECFVFFLEGGRGGAVCLTGHAALFICKDEEKMSYSKTKSCDQIVVG